MSGRALPPARLLAVVAPVSLVGVAAFCAATFFFLREPGSTTTVVGVLAFLVASTLAERFPVPVEGADANGVSLGFVFTVAALVLFGWAPATVVCVTAPTLVALIWRTRPPIRATFNAGVFGIVGAVAGLILRQMHGTDAPMLAAKVGAMAATLYIINILLVTAAIAASGSELGYVKLIRSNVRWTIVPFTLMASTALMLVVLWQRTPYLFAALAGPLVAISLYQRSTHKALNAIRLALTDPLTGLGNHRHFHERLQRELAQADEHGGMVSLCFLDIDDFKRINDQFGHPAGDRVLSQVASRLRQGGESFRLGGDEFAVLLVGMDEQLALATTQSIVLRIAETELGKAGQITVSAGVATFPQHGRERDSLIRLADGALYWAKEHGKNQVRLARADVAELSEFRRVASGADRIARFRAAASLARAVDSRDAYTGSHSERVANLAAEIATRLGLPAEEVELTRLAGSLHDLGKLAIPEEILRKPAALSDAERLVLERHPQIGYRMLESLGVDPIAYWVLHHHERWDGSGYPDGLAGDRIPLGARIIFVSDAFDAMTSDRIYRESLSFEDAVAEVERCAGSQFDPEVVHAFLACVGAQIPVSA
ncbi:MAG TPA: diguanylate cyclase [Gaiellaceae bacterium]|jgi:diguanylate cyclase (GGDEF)-like protein/putative nucleotidyltransferase with HDIG domain|nr:diguanylate cyclase [Gaiellaceae bacterium]